VVCFNRCENFWDVLNVFTNCLADPAFGQQARAIDFYNNDLYNVTDNFIETDGGYANIRVLRSILDHNAHRVGLPAEKPFVFNGQAFPSLAALADATGHEQHGWEIRDYDEVFAATEEPEHAPNNQGRLYRPDEVDLRPF
jgi:hypothetical protein